MQTTANDAKRRPTRVLGSLLALSVVLACGLTLARVAAAVVSAGLAGAPVAPADAVLALLALIGVLGLAWLVLGVVLEGLARVPGAVGRAAARVSAALSPLVVRRVAAVVLGVGVGATGLGAGSALGAPVRAAGAAVAGVVAPAGGAAEVGDPLPDPGWHPAPDPGWTPTAPAVRVQPDVAVVSGRGTAQGGADEVVVRRGDSLWSIAARHLGAGATDAEVAAEWPRWYSANRDVVGEDPDRLLPGQVLHAPAVVGS